MITQPLTSHLLTESENSHGVVEEAWFLLLERVAQWLLERHFLKHLNPFLVRPFRPSFLAEFPR